jgi:acetyltransferase-like isoleucine patch superfamily enzyme
MPVAADVILEPGVVLHHRDLVNLYGCRIGRDTIIGPFVEIQRGVVVGACCKISSHSFLCEGVTLEDEVFVGHGVIFVNDRRPKAAINGRLASAADWTVGPIKVGRGASIGSGAIILCDLTIGPEALIGAGAVVTHNVDAGTIVAGVPARLL